MAQLSDKLLIDRRVLEKLGECRLREARVLARAKCHVGAVYLAGYAVECHLKAAICKTLDCEKMPATFKTHDLDLLLLHSGLARKIENVPGVRDRFAKISAVWTMDGPTVIRYQEPDRWDGAQTKQFLGWVAGPGGVVPWVKKQG